MKINKKNIPESVSFISFSLNISLSLPYFENFLHIYILSHVAFAFTLQVHGFVIHLNVYFLSKYTPNASIFR